MQFEKIQLNAPHLTLWLSEDKGLVFHQGQKELSQIEPISIALLIALDEGLTNEQAIIELQQHSNLSKEQLKPSLEQVKVLFKNTQEQRTYADGLYPELQNHIIQQPQQHAFCVKVASATFAITCDDERLLSEIKALLAPIQITTPNEVQFAIEIAIYKGNYLLISNDIVVEEGLKQNQVIPVFIDRLQILAYQHSDYCFGFHGAALTTMDYRLRVNDGGARECDGAGKYSCETESRHSRLVRETTSEASEQKNMDPRIGSGILLRSTSSVPGVVREEDGEERGNDDEGAPSSSFLVPSSSSLSPSSLAPNSSCPSVTILLPGVSGAGKSTLTAELSKQNFSVYSDEIIALNNDFNLTTLALPMAIKSGSWQHIAKLYPEIVDQPEWHRVDGRILKYIWPEQIAGMDYRLRGNDGEECGNDEEERGNDGEECGNGEEERGNDNGGNCHSQLVRETTSEALSSHSQLVRETTSEALSSHSVIDTDSSNEAQLKGIDSDLRQEEVDGAPSSSFLVPNTLDEVPNTSTFLLSPNYQKEATPNATQLSVVETIALVTNGGYQLGVELTPDRVDQLIQYCEKISAYQMTYANSEQAQQLVEQLCKQ
ncbi:hypothetical protein RGQ13_13875 [Thalassotalea psychrophila]|uniref:Uncharacterized protein n=1 Tax=Thalassotalea psychrophila TaxID=3065647 RepID=A0ABY9TR34_9GAMM|nr:hypothetical protein RGQ13_13875 [Colwelliaceae bacterium SQ149]